jgi:hypothetical protein
MSLKDLVKRTEKLETDSVKGPCFVIIKGGDIEEISCRGKIVKILRGVSMDDL